MSPACVRGSRPVNDDGNLVHSPEQDSMGERYIVETYDAFGKRTAYRAIRWYDSRGVEWQDDPSQLARETLQNYLD
jgi:hypothetical protein